MFPDALQKHTYPLWVRILGMVSCLLFLILVPRFLLIDLPVRKQMYARIHKADSFFNRKEYKDAIDLYVEIIQEYPQFKKGRIKLVQSFFALSAPATAYYGIGLLFMENEKYTVSEIESIERFLPEDYKEDFRSMCKG